MIERNTEKIDYRQALEEQWRKMGKMSIPPNAFEGSRAHRAVKVSLNNKVHVSIEEVNPAGKVKVSGEGVSEVTLNTD